MNDRMAIEGKIILHVDDDADDRDLLKEFVESIAPHVKVVFAENGLQAMEHLNASKETPQLPCLIVLDLNMPYLNGVQTFHLIRSDAHFRNIPLVIFSSGEHPSDKSLFSKEGVTYFKKPSELSSMREIVEQLTAMCT